MCCLLKKILKYISHLDFLLNSLKPSRAGKEEPKLDVTGIRTLQTSLLVSYQPVLSPCFGGGRVCWRLAWERPQTRKRGARSSVMAKSVALVSWAQLPLWAHLHAAPYS